MSRVYIQHKIESDLVLKKYQTRLDREVGDDNRILKDEYKFIKQTESKGQHSKALSYERVQCS